MNARHALGLLFLVGGIAGPPRALHAKPRGRAAAGGAGPLKIVRKLKGHENTITALAFGRDGTTLASGGLDSTLKLWDAGKDKGNPLRSIALGEGVIIHQVAFHPGRPQFAAATSEGVIVFSEGGEKQFKLGIGKSGVEDVAYGPEGDSIAAVAAEGVQTWTSEDGAKVKGTDKIKNGKAVAFRPTSPGLVAVGREGGIVLWYPSDGEMKEIKAEGEIVSLAFSPDGKHLASFGTDRAVRCFDAGGASQIWEHANVANDTKVAWNSKGTVVISGGDDDVVRAFGASDGADAWEWHAPSPDTRVVAVSRSGNLMASAGESTILVLTGK